MDRTIYRYFVDEIRTDSEGLLGILPIDIVRTPWDQSTSQSIANCAGFLRTIINEIENPSLSPFAVPSILKIPDNTLSLLFKAGHLAIFDILEGVNPIGHGFKSNGIQLLKFLTLCANPTVDQAFYSEDVLSLAMLSFLTEALMYCNWSPDAFEGNAKRAAHEYALTLKKNMYRTSFKAKGVIAGYLWAAWFLAEKTEGIRVNTASFQSMHKIEWNIRGSSRAYIVEKSTTPHLFYLLAHCNDRIPHPVSSMVNDGKTGLFLTLNGNPIIAETLIDSEKICRIKKTGYKFRHKCSTSSLQGITWTTVIFVFQQTFYRIDILTLPQSVEEVIIRSELALEISKQNFSHSSNDQPLVEFIENPLHIAFKIHEDGNKAFFSSEPMIVKTDSAIQMTVAWTFNPKATSIDRTHLIGIYD